MNSAHEQWILLCMQEVSFHDDFHSYNNSIKNQLSPHYKSFWPILNISLLTERRKNAALFMTSAASFLREQSEIIRLI